jgi:Ca-activated chloride channel family protein
MPHQSAIRNLESAIINALLLLVPVFAGAQVQPRLVESVSVGYVMVPFTALDAKGRAIADLRERDVHLIVDGKEVRTNLFEKSNGAPVSFTVLVDGSGSMALGGKMDAARAAIDSLTLHHRPGDDFSVFLFSQGEATELVPFTDNVVAVRQAIWWRVKPYGKTAFFDALAKMPDRSREGRNPTRAIILLTDGIDNASNLTRDQLESLLQGVNIPIYPLGLRDVIGTTGREALIREDAADLALLDRVASLTGGRMFVGTDPAHLQEAISSIDMDLRSQYLIGFSPTGKGGVKYRQISLKFTRKVRSVRVREGYRGTDAPGLPTGRRGAIHQK